MTSAMRSLLLATALLATAANVASGQDQRDDAIMSPVLRANVTVSSDIVRIGDVIDNAGPAAQIAIYRAPDLGMVGTLSTAQVIAALRQHQVIGVNTRDLKSITVTRLSRSIDSKDIENQVAQALENRHGLGAAANLSLTFDREVQGLQLDANNTGAMQPTSARFDARSGRFDVTFTIGNESNAPTTKLRFTGVAVETVEAVVLARGVERNEIIKSSDVILERRPKAEVGNDSAARDRVIGMQSRRQIRAGQAIKNADLAKPDLVVRDQAVTLIYESSGLYLTIRGKAVEGGTEGDVVNVLNLQSKRTVAGVVVGRGQVAVSAPSPRLPAQVEAPVSPAAPASESTAPDKISQARPALNNTAATNPPLVNTQLTRSTAIKTPTASSPIAVAANEHVPISPKAE